MKKNRKNKNNQSFAPGDHVVAYLRDSGGTEQELSVEQQEKVVKEWCAERGLVLDEVYKDVAKPGSTVIGRDEFERMMQYFRSKECSVAGVLLWKYSRFSRDFDDAQFYKANIRRRGYLVYSIQDQVPEGSTGRFIEVAIDWANARYLEDLS